MTWTPSPNVTIYYLVVTTSLGVAVFQGSFLPSTSTYTVTGLQSFSIYTATLTTGVVSVNATKVVSVITLVSPVSFASLLTITATSVTFQFLPSTGATGYDFLAEDDKCANLLFLFVFLFSFPLSCLFPG